MERSANEAWLESFSMEAYRPMVRLASGTDSPFLAGTRGRRTARRYSRTQRNILREYLRGLYRDYEKLHSIACSREDTAELYDGQLSFVFGILWIEARLAIQTVIPHRIDLEPLLDSVEALANATRETMRPHLRARVI